MKKSYSNPIRGVLITCAMLLITTFAFAQARLTGKITDSAGNGIPGVSILVKGTKSGSTTDASGNYSVTAPANSSLVISSIGFKTQEVKVGNQSSLNIAMVDDASTFDEVVVTGYTVDKRRDATGAVSIVKAKDLAVRPSGNIEAQLQGRVAGLTVIPNGQPGANSQVRVRGYGAFGGNEPLVVIDGVPSSSNYLNPDDVETVTVLKDASTASIYGARAANGVIVYTTKKGKKSAKKLEVSYDGLYGLTNPGDGQAMMNPTDFATWTWNAKRNSGEKFDHPQFGTGATPVIPDYISVGGTPGVTGSVDLAKEKLKYNIVPANGAVYQVIKANKAGTNWYKEITRMAPVHRHSLGFSGGGENSRFYIGLGLQDQQGILLSNAFKRYSVRINTEFNVLKNLRLGENLQMTYLQNLGQSGANGGEGIAADENDLLQAFRMPSIIPVYDEFGGYAGTAAKGFNNPRNPVANQNGALNNRNYNALANGNIYLEFDPIENLTLRSSLGGGFNNFYGWNYTRWQYENSENNSAFGYGENGGFNLSWVLTNTAAYKKTFGKHGVEILAGQEALNTGAGRNMGASGLNPFSTDLDYVTLSTLGSRNQPGSNLGRGINFYSLFGRAIYNFNDKYMLTGVIRRDGSSRFGANNRYGVFPAVSAAWRLSSESFMKGLSWVQDLKIRGGYGTMGNSNSVNPNNQYSLYSTGVGNTNYDINGSNSGTVEGYARNRIGNPDTKWETSVTKNIGFDGTFLNGKLDVIFDVWQKDTKDLLYQLPITGTAGAFAAAPSVNVGEMMNRGVDLQVITRGNITNDLRYTLDLTGGFLKNEIVSIANKLTYLTDVNPGFRGNFPIRNQLGKSISSFYGLQVLGLFQTKEEVAAAPAQDGKGVGRFRYADINGDGKINADDRTYLGSPVPKFTGGGNLTFNYKNFDLSTYVNVVAGNKIYNHSKWYTDFYPSFSGAAISERVKDSWSPTNTGATIPIFETASNFSTNAQSNSFYVEDGSYFRMQNINIGYNLAENTLKKLGLSRVRVFGAINNLFTITKYQGLDVGAVAGNADTNFGIDVGSYPLTKSWNVGLNVGF
jgi:TonB-dependent starch-binding outer membrane protein SusC